MKRKIQKLTFSLLLVFGFSTNIFAQWQHVGTASFSQGDAQFLSPAFSSTDEPYVAYSDGSNSGKATVMKFSNTSTGLNNLITTNSFYIFPNPTKNIINFPVQTNAQLTSITGQIVADRKNVNLLDLSNQPTGIYFLTLILIATVK